MSERLGYDPFRADAAELVLVRVEEAGADLLGRLQWRDAAGDVLGERVFPSRSGDCAELARAMEFALALQIQLMASAVQSSRTAASAAPAPATVPAPAAAAATTPTAEPPPPAAAAATAPPAPPPAPSEPAALVERGVAAPAAPGQGQPGAALLAGAGAAAAFGVSSTAVPVGRLFVAAAWPRLAVELSGEASAPSTTRRADGAGFDQEQFLVGVAGCARRAAFSLCAVGKVGVLRVSGTDVDVPLSASSMAAQAGLRLALRQPLGQRTFVSARAEGLGRIMESTITLDGMPVWRTPRFAVQLGLDVAVRFE